MRAWSIVLAVVLATTVQAIVAVASTDSAMGLLQQKIPSASAQSKSQHHKPRLPRSSPTLSFAAIVAIPVQEELSLTNLNNIVLNSDNVKHPSQEQNNNNSAQQQLQQLLVPTNSSTEETSSSVSSPSANAVVNTKSSSNNNNNSLYNNNNISGNSNLINSNQIASAETTRARRRNRKRPAKGHRRNNRRKQHRTRSENSVQLEQEVPEMLSISSNELNVEVTKEEEEDVEEEPEPEPARVKPDPETLVSIEKNLLALFGFKKRPSIDRSKVVIPEAMRRMYAETTGMELDLPDLPKPGVRGHMTANTVRSFTHEGESQFLLLIVSLIDCGRSYCRCELVNELDQTSFGDLISVQSSSAGEGFIC